MEQMTVIRLEVVEQYMVQTQLQEILNINGAEYNVTLTDLKPYTQYYYYVNAMNTEGSSSSALKYFMTDEDGM